MSSNLTLFLFFFATQTAPIMEDRLKRELTDMKDYVKVIGQVLAGVVAGNMISKGVDAMADKAKKAVEKKKQEKSRN